jgi:hypothetical protein
VAGKKQKSLASFASEYNVAQIGVAVNAINLLVGD